MWENDKHFKMSVNSCTDLIHKQNPGAVVVYTATLPSPGDKLSTIRTAGYRNGYLSQLAHDAPWLEFSCPGKQLLATRGPVKEFFDEFDMLNDAGLDVVRRGLEAKIRCAKLFEKVTPAARRDS